LEETREWRAAYRKDRHIGGVPECFVEVVSWKLTGAELQSPNLKIPSSVSVTSRLMIVFNNQHGPSLISKPDM
jgi:hypothetical protein